MNTVLPENNFQDPGRTVWRFKKDFQGVQRNHDDVFVVVAETDDQVDLVNITTQGTISLSPKAFQELMTKCTWYE